ncbi:MAG: sigma 54-interacting transcriptional regulator, partial [Candidatus Babeliales bacterium]
FYFNHPEPIYLLGTINKTAIVYYVLLLSPISLFFVLLKLHRNLLPHILTKQLYIIIYGLTIPYLTSDLIQYFPFLLKFSLTENYTAASFSALFLSISLFYCSRKVMGLRFLNLSQYVYGPPKPDFVTHFKTVLEKLSEVASTYELQPIVQQFLQQALLVPSEKVRLYLRPAKLLQEAPAIHYNMLTPVEMFLESDNVTAAQELMKKEKVLIYDEISFSNFYDQTPAHQQLLQFLETINADIFLPIYYKNKTMAYIIVERHARQKELYNSAERDEMIMFTNYLSNTINILHNQTDNSIKRKFTQLEDNIRKLDKENSALKQTALDNENNFRKQFEQTTKQYTQKEETLKKELYFKHQEVSQYRECVQSLLYKSLQPSGTIFYKNNHFTFGNQEAKDLVQININNHIGHPLVKKLKQVTNQVTNFRTPKTIVAKNDAGESLALAVVPHAESGNAIITVSHATIELVKQKLNLLKDQSQWDYLLHLETTNSGRLINELIPGNGQTLLDFKIDLLKAALSKKAALIDSADDDLNNIASLIHQISLREELYTLTMQGTLDAVTMATKLFGINPLFSAKKDESALLELLNGRGTLFIKDIHLLNLECQEYLAEFIRYGMYRPYKSEEWKQSNVRIICSSNQDIFRLVNEKKFSRTLFKELKQTVLRIPALTYLSKEELDSLADGFSQQIIAGNTGNNLLTLTEKNKEKLVKIKPVSFYELKNCVKQLIMHKAEKSNIQHEIIIDPDHETNDPLLQHAARLGKLALKDKKIMTMLWRKFDKNQNKIAQFLGVNRSTIHRRCHLYRLD